jgi:uncharacterized membrane protein
MAEAVTKAKRRGKDAADQADDARSQVDEQAQDAAPESDGAGEDEQTGGDSGGSRSDGHTLTAELRDAIREAAVEVLKPVVRKATTSAAKYAVTKGPGLVKDKLGPKLEDAGGPGGLAKGVASKGGGIAESVGGVASGVAGKIGGGKKKEGESPSGTGRGRRLPVQEYVDVGVDLQTAYDQFTQFEDWPEFMHRVERIEQRDDSTLMWHENVWGVRRSWEAEITDQTPCERIAWRSNGGPQTIGVVTFHRLSDRLTRIYITMDFQPKGLFEKAASGMRISRRALRSDLMRFKAFVELKDEATGAWRGRIEDGEVVDEQDEGEDTPQDREGGDEPKASEHDDEELEEEDEDEQPRASEEEDDEDFEEEEEDEEEQPRASADEDDQDDEYDEEEEPRASEGPDAQDEEEDEDEEPRPRRRRTRAPARRTASAGSGRGTS